MLNVLKFNAKETTIFMQIYQIFGGIFPLFGSALSDGHIGKFKTILYGTLLYGAGKILMSGWLSTFVYPFVSFL
jgi:dipeptide/tripeptide permease